MRRAVGLEEIGPDTAVAAAAELGVRTQIVAAVPDLVLTDRAAGQLLQSRTGRLEEDLVLGVRSSTRTCIPFLEGRHLDSRPDTRLDLQADRRIDSWLVLLICETPVPVDAHTMPHNGNALRLADR